jgi:hypothetical protein
MLIIAFPLLKATTLEVKLPLVIAAEPVGTIVPFPPFTVIVALNV